MIENVVKEASSNTPLHYGTVRPADTDQLATAVGEGNLTDPWMGSVRVTEGLEKERYVI